MGTENKRQKTKFLPIYALLVSPYRYTHTHTHPHMFIPEPARSMSDSLPNSFCVRGSRIAI